MTEAIIVAIITGVLTLVGVIISNQRNDAVQSERIEQIRTDIKRLEDEQKAHNKLIERTYNLEDRANRVDDELKRVNKRLEVVEGRTA